MKYVALRCLEQWKNLKEYFLKFLPKQKNFKREVEKTQRYLRIKTALSDNITEAYVSFVAFVAHDFQEFLVPFQSTEPMIHLLCPSLCKLMSTLQRKFVKKSKLSDDITKNVYINVSEDRNIKPISHIDVGTKAKILLSGNTIMASDKEKKFRQDCLNFFVTAVQYLQSNLPYVSLLQHAQYIHPAKRNDSGSLKCHL
jgi:hypothetical protein